MGIDRKAFLKERLLGHLQRLPQVAEEFRANPSQKNFNDLAMELFQISNYLLALMEEVVRERRLGTPLSYGELVELLERAEVLEGREGDLLRRMIRYRNLVGHEYYQMGKEELLEYAEVVRRAARIVGKL